MYNHNKAQQSKNRVHIPWDILYSLVYVQLKLRYIYNNKELNVGWHYIGW